VTSRRPALLQNSRRTSAPPSESPDFARGWQITIEDLGNLIRRLEEKKADFSADATARVRTGFEAIDLHPLIAAVCTDLYRDGHYRNAVLDASVALVNMLKEKSRRRDLDGAPFDDDSVFQEPARAGLQRPEG